MREWRKSLIVALGAAMFVSCSQKQQGQGIDVSFGEENVFKSVNDSLKPGDDFYKYATGNWIKSHPNKDNWYAWGPEAIMGYANEEKFGKLVQDIASQNNPKGSPAQKIGDMYNLYMDTARLNREGAQPILPYLKEIDDANSKEELLKIMAKNYYSPFFICWISADSRNSRNNIVQVVQLFPGFTDLIFQSKEDFWLKIRASYENLIENAFKYCGDSPEMAQIEMKRVMRLNDSIYKANLTREEYFNPNNYHKMSVDEMSSLTGLNWKLFFEQYSLEIPNEVSLNHIEPVKKACRIFLDEPMEDVKSLMKWHVIGKYHRFLGMELYNEFEKFGDISKGGPDGRPRWKHAYDYLNESMPTPMGQLYVEHFFSKEQKERVEGMVSDIKHSLSEIIQQQEWLCDSSKALSLKKLELLKPHVGYPDEWNDVSGLEIDPQLSLLENNKNIELYNTRQIIKRRLNKPVDKDEWGMSPQTINACYVPTSQGIFLPAAILQKPYFDMEADDAYNYAYIGSVIGHELTHAFDNTGRNFDMEGNVKQWWTDKDIENFNSIGDTYAAYYDSLVVLPGLNCNGRLTLGENIADLSGLKAAFRAMQKANADGHIKEKYGFTPEQRFFITYANSWLFFVPDEKLRVQTQTDEHAVPMLRANGPLPHFDEWYKAFDIKPEDAMYIPSEKRVRLW